MILLLSVYFFQNQLFQKILSDSNTREFGSSWSWSSLQHFSADDKCATSKERANQVLLFKINFFKNSFKNTKQFGSGPNRLQRFSADNKSLLAWKELTMLCCLLLTFFKNCLQRWQKMTKVTPLKDRVKPYPFELINEHAFISTQQELI